MMRGNKRLVQGIAAAGATGILACTVTFSQQQIIRTENTIPFAADAAGIVDALSPENYLDEILSQTVSIERHDSYREAASVPIEKITFNTKNDKAEDNDSASSKEIKTETEKKTEAEKETDSEKKAEADKNTKTEKTASETKDEEKDTKTEKTASETKDEKTEDTKSKQTKSEKQNTKKQASEAEKWENKLMADVDDSLNIREAKSEKSKIVGRLRKGDAADIIKQGKYWTQIKSGSVTGYVKNDYCVFGADAYKLAKKICGTYAVVQADGLRIRSKANKKASVLDAAYQGDKLQVNTKAKEKENWVVVNYEDKKGYVSKEFVDVRLVAGKAISIEEEMAQIAAKKKAEQQAAVKSVSSSSAASAAASSSASVQPVSGDLTLLSAIIFCEAGGESYAGQIAVGAVVMNRVRSGSFPNSISGVVYQSGQFTPVANGSLARALSNGNYRNCMSAARAALAGSDNTGGAKYFHRANGAAGLVIGNHVFY